MRSIAGLIFAQAAAAALTIRDEPRTRPDGSAPLPFDPGPVPNDLGPVIDTTKESKRARRRRLAKQRKGGAEHG